MHNGEFQFTNPEVEGNPAISSGNWYSLRIVVKANKNVDLFLNDKKIGNFNAKFTTRGYGGYMIGLVESNILNMSIQYTSF